ncbi:MAG TPA: sugar kinase [Chryseosolibacter sp.]|nr:sugar kinase [Chryseosolibacter sp.]
MQPLSEDPTEKTVITFGEVMLRLSTVGHTRFTQAQQFVVNYAGAEANVAVSCSLFGLRAAHVTRFPDHDLGRAATQALARFGVDTRHIHYGDERLGLYFLENGSMQRSSRIIYDRFDSAFANIRPGEFDWDTILAGADWFHYTGITPAISQGAADELMKALEAARKAGVQISGDINYRRNLWQYGKSARDIMPELIALTDFVVAGQTDIENCCGITGRNYEEACQRMMKEFPAVRKIASTERTSVSSSHNRICGMLWNGKALLKSKEFDLTHIVDRIGAGDAFMAGLVFGFVTGRTDQDALEFAAAACAWKHSVDGDFNIGSVAEINALVQGENVGKLLR